MKISSKIRKLLKSQGIYESIDEPLIRDIDQHLLVMELSKKDIEEHGVIINLRTHISDSDPYYQTNPAIRTYNASSRLVAMLYKRLGISPPERNKLGIDKKPIDDGFNI